MRYSTSLPIDSLNFLTEINLRCAIPCIPGYRMGPVCVAVNHTNGVDLFFVTLDARWCANVVPEDPGFTCLFPIKHVVRQATGEHRGAHCCQISVNRVVLNGDQLSLLALLHSFEYRKDYIISMIKLAEPFLQSHFRCNLMFMVSILYSHTLYHLE